MTTTQYIPDELRSRLFLAFAPQTAIADAVARFIARFGVEPAWAIQARNNLLLGPIPVGTPC